jgi:5-methyltetrahydropteroyltriglutamate--homocysteine methyltransferase
MASPFSQEFMKRSTPPFRADQVGSFLRPKHLLEARSKRERSEIPAADLEAIEDAAIEKLVAKQESIGLETATDGEFRRTFWHLDFLVALDGVQRCEASHGIQFHGGQKVAAAARGPRPVTTARVPRTPAARSPAFRSSLRCIPKARVACRPRPRARARPSTRLFRRRR